MESQLDMTESPFLSTQQTINDHLEDSGLSNHQWVNYFSLALTCKMEWSKNSKKKKNQILLNNIMKTMRLLSIAMLMLLSPSVQTLTMVTIKSLKISVSSVPIFTMYLEVKPEKTESWRRKRKHWSEEKLCLCPFPENLSNSMINFVIIFNYFTNIYVNFLSFSKSSPVLVCFCTKKFLITSLFLWDKISLIG